jgi:hypothetical protein
VENSASLPLATHFHDYYLHDEKRVKKLLDSLFNPHQSLPELIQKHLTTIKSYLGGTQPFEDFCKEGTSLIEIFSGKYLSDI